MTDKPMTAAEIEALKDGGCNHGPIDSELLCGNCLMRLCDTALAALSHEELGTRLAQAVEETPNWVKAAVRTAHDERVYDQWGRIQELVREYLKGAKE